MTFIFRVLKSQPDFGSPENTARFRQEMKENEGKEYRITKIVRTRSLKQNKLYWFYLGLIERETGDDRNSLHEYLTRALLPPIFVTVLGKEVKLPQSTTNLNKTQFSEYLERICALTGVPIPDTELYNKYYDSAPMLER